MNNEESTSTTNQMLNKLRAAVLGANDGIVSISAVLMGIAGAGSGNDVLFMAGMAALVAGALSMAVGEYVSVSSQSDAERAFIAKEKQELADDPEGELQELADEYEALGISKKTARKVAEELTAKDALKAHLRMHFALDPEDLVSPWQAAVASLVAFTVGGAVPFAAILLAPDDHRILVTIVAVMLSLFVTGYVSAHAGGAPKSRAIARIMVGGLLAMGITYYVGMLFGGVSV